VFDEDRPEFDDTRRLIGQRPNVGDVGDRHSVPTDPPPRRRHHPNPARTSGGPGHVEDQHPLELCDRTEIPGAHTGLPRADDRGVSDHHRPAFGDVDAAPEGAIGEGPHVPDHRSRELESSPLHPNPRAQAAVDHHVLHHDLSVRLGPDAGPIPRQGKAADLHRGPGVDRDATPNNDRLGAGATKGNGSGQERGLGVGSWCNRDHRTHQSRVDGRPDRTKVGGVFWARRVHVQITRGHRSAGADRHAARLADRRPCRAGAPRGEDRTAATTFLEEPFRARRPTHRATFAEQRRHRPARTRGRRHNTSPLRARLKRRFTRPGADRLALGHPDPCVGVGCTILGWQDPGALAGGVGPLPVLADDGGQLGRRQRLGAAGRQKSQPQRPSRDHNLLYPDESRRAIHHGPHGPTILAAGAEQPQHCGRRVRSAGGYVARAKSMNPLATSVFRSWTTTCSPTSNPWCPRTTRPSAVG
jgi:hypothetical protein